VVYYSPTKLIETTRELATRKIPFESEPSYELPKLVSGGKRPIIPDDCPKDFRKLIEWCWQQQSSQRPSFADIVKLFEKKGLLDDALVGGCEQDDTLTKLESLEKRLDELRVQKDKLERLWESTERRADREKDSRGENERATEDLERQISKEKEKVTSTDRQLQSIERKLALERDQANEAQQKKKKAEKKVEQKRKAQKEELQQEKEAAERKVEVETRKTAPLRRQIEEAEALLEQERTRRLEVERQRDELERNIRATGSLLSPERSDSSSRSRSPLLRRI